MTTLLSESTELRLTALDSSRLPCLFEDSSTQPQLDYTFKQRLEEEQKRLNLCFSPLNPFDFSSWFSYPAALQNTTRKSTLHVQSLEMSISKNNAKEAALPSSSSLGIENSCYQNNPPSILSQSQTENLPQDMLQNCLLKSGWLIPNLESQPLFFRAQLDGKMLNTFDLQSLIDQIISQVKLVKEKGKSELTLGMRSDNLGEILLTITAKHGSIAVQIQAQEETRKLLQAKLTELTIMLKKAQVNLSEIKIDVIKEEEKHA